MSEKYFIHFGCWNKGHNYFISGQTESQTEDNTEMASDLTNVMRRLNEVTDEIKPEFIVVAGDNYYPNKITIPNEKGEESKLKLFDENDMKSGFDGLPKNVEVDVIMGNHDYETNLYIAEKDQIETSCKILKLEYDIERLPNNNLNILINKVRKFDDNTLVLMIDTTIYSDHDAEAVVNCYRLHPNFKTGIVDQNLTIEMIREKQANFIRDSILQNVDDNLRNVIIVGHHPITAFKLKKGKTNLINEPGEPFVDALYKNIFNVLDDMDRPINYYYLCADLHQYQIGNIAITPEGSNKKMLIKQYTVGTGGAEKDPFPFSFNPDDDLSIERDRIVFNKNGISYNVDYLMTPEELKLSGSKYGFLQCTSDGNNLSFKFIDVDNRRYEETDPTQGLTLLSGQSGGKRKNKTQKYKNKKNNRFYKSIKRKKVLKSQKRKKNKGKNRKTKKVRKYKN